MTDEQPVDRRQEFLDLLRGGAEPPPASSQPETAPALPEEPAPAAPAQPAPAAPAPETPTEAAQPEQPPAEAPPLTFEQQPPPAADVPPALSALATDPPAEAAPAASAAGADLMDLGHDAQLQGTAISLRSIANRLQLVAEGLKAIPTLQNIAADLQTLNYPQVAQAVDALIEWAQGEEQALISSLEQRGSARRGDAPA